MLRPQRRESVDAVAAFRSILSLVMLRQSSGEEGPDARRQRRRLDRVVVVAEAIVDAIVAFVVVAVVVAVVNAVVLLRRRRGIQQPVQLRFALQTLRQRGSASLLQRDRQDASSQQHHFRFGGRRRHDWE